MDYNAFYRELFAPLESSIGPIDPNTIVAIVGFDAGGPLNFSTIGYSDKSTLATFVSCELAIHPEQRPASFGRYELLTSCNDERWVRSTLTELGHATTEFKFGHRHTLDIGVWVESDAPFQGLLLERESTAQIDGKKYGVMRVIGLTRAELDFAVKKSVPQLIKKLKDAGVYPNTIVKRESVV
ncbi:suppressor of fused domain protein [Novipirellula sp. SH528]|uniref:suppressor of fused domain protein n=1 Tax=Novipirellula sp. SH528 TaxID=3454466 RepID=UPI003FA0D27A